MSDERGEPFYLGNKTLEEHYNGRWEKQLMAAYCWSIDTDVNSIGHYKQTKKEKILTTSRMFEKILFLLVYKMIWWKYLLVYSNVLLLNNKGLLVIAKLVFPNNWINMFWYKYELRDLFYVTLRSTALDQYHIVKQKHENI